MKNFCVFSLALGLGVALTNAFGRPAVRHFTDADNVDSTSVEVDSVMSAEIDSVLADALDSNLYVVAWFDKCDTMTYWINESSWNVKDGDTVKTSGLSTKVMLSVLSSTRKGYRIEYKFVDFQYDTIENQMLNDLQSRIVRLLTDRIKGSSIIFRTNEYGGITKYENYKELKVKAKDIYSSACEELSKVPVMDSLKSVGLDLAAVLSKVPGEAIADGYKDDIDFLFSCHGSYYKIGDFREHADASDDEYESDTHLHIGLDEETLEYEISTDVSTIIPSNELKPLVSAVMNSFADQEFMDKFDAEYDKAVYGNATSDTYVYCGYFSDGWPMEFISQTAFMLNGQGKLKQKYIIWDYRAVANH